MNDRNKTKKQLIDELIQIRQRFTELGTSKSEDKYRTLVENSSDIIMRFDRQYRHLYISPSVTKFVTFKPEDFIGKTYRELGIPDKQCNLLEERIQRVFETCLPWEEEFEFQSINGQVVFNWRLFPELGLDGKVTTVLGVSRDITEQKRTEEVFEQHSHLLANMNILAIELASLSSDAILSEFVVKKIKELTGAVGVVFSDYDPSSRMLITSHLEVNPGILEKITRLLGKRLKDIHSPVSEEMYHEITSNLIGKRQTLTEATLGAIPSLVSSAIQKLLDIAHFIGIGYVIEGELYGTSLLAIKTDMPDPPIELLKSFAHMVAVSLRRRRTEEALRESEKRYHSLLEGVPLGIYRTTPSGQIMDANIACVNMLGYPDRHTFLADKASEIYVDHVTRAQRLSEINRKGFIDTEIQLRRYDGTQIWVRDNCRTVKDNQGQPLYYEGSLEDITERKRSEEALIESERKYRELVENANSIILRRNVNGIVTFFNEYAQRFFGYNEDEILGKNVIGTIVPETDSFGRDLVSMIHEISQHPEQYASNENENMKRNGERIWISWTNKPITDENGKVIEILCIGNDITARMNSEERLHESNRRLEETLNELQVTQHRIIQQERLSALGQLASGIAHDFNNALMPILGYSDMLLDAPYLVQDEKTVHKYIEQINIAAMDARDTVNRLREFYRIREEDEFTLINLNELIQQAIQLTKMKWRDQALANGITISILTDLQEIPSVNGIEAGLRGVLTNLIINSVDAMPVDGTISLRTRFMGTNVVLEVNDTGVGMTEEVKQRCFEPFFSTKGLNGTGLGLSLVHDIIRRHEGKINVESEAGKGTTFIIHLPIPTEIKYKEKAQEVELSLQSLHVLVIDDAPLIQNLLGAYLNIDGHSFDIASNGREGLAKLRSGSFNLVITDRAMPDIGGDQLADIIKQTNPEMPVIMITGFGSIMEASGEMLKNVDYLLSKPVSLSTFRKTLLKIASNQALS